MKASKNNIEGLFKEGFKDYSVSPSNSVWNKINRNLGFRNFLKFNPGKFNIYYTVVIGITTSVVLYNTLNNHSTTAQNNISVKNEILSSENNSLKDNKKIGNYTEIQTNEVNNNEVTIKNNYLKENINNTKTDLKILQILQNEDIIEDIITKAKSNDEVIENVKLAEPYAEFSVSLNEACVPVAVQFLNASENCDSYSWDFGNGETSSDINPTFVFRTAGIYTVTLTVKSGSISKTTSTRITVNPKPVSEFIVSDKDQVFENDDIKFANLSTDYQSCIWDFGDNNSSSFIHPTYSYDKSGLYNVSLICISDKNCSDTSELENLQIRDSKYQILAPTGLYTDLNGPGDGYIQNGIFSKTIFSPVFNYETAEYYLRIYNRFGSVVFESKDPNFGWNGYFNNKPAPIATYIWECSGQFADGKVFVKTGNLTLLYLNNQ